MSRGSTISTQPDDIEQMIPQAWDVFEHARREAVPDPITAMLGSALWDLEDALDALHPNPIPFVESVELAMAVVAWCLP